jgi:hypothetical protein
MQHLAYKIYLPIQKFKHDILPLDAMFGYRVMFTPILFLEPSNHFSCCLPFFMAFVVVMQLGAIQFFISPLKAPLSDVLV